MDHQGRISAPQVLALVTELEGRPLSRGMLQHYTREGYVKPRPLLKRSSQRGRPASVGYDLADVVLLRWLVRLNAQGVKVRRFARGLRHLHSLMPEAMSRPDKLTFFVVDGKNCAVTFASKRSIQITGKLAGQVLLTFATHPDLQETKQAAERFFVANETRGCA